MYRRICTERPVSCQAPPHLPRTKIETKLSRLPKRRLLAATQPVGAPLWRAGMESPHGEATTAVVRPVTPERPRAPEPRVRPQKSAAQSPGPLGLLKTQAASRSRVPLAAHAPPVARYPAKCRRHKKHPIRRVLVREPRPPRLARSAAGTARRKRLPSQGVAAVTACLTGYYEQDFATGLGVFRRRKRPSNAHSHSTYHHRGVLRMLRGPHNTRPQSKGVRRNSLPDSRFFARLMTRSMSVLWPKSPQ